MISTPNDRHAPLRCPTCNASQDWSDVCRRCKCDLSLMVALLRRRERLQDACRRALRAGQYEEARRSALACLAISSDPDTLRLLAVSCLASGRTASAVRVVQTALGAGL